MKNPVFVLVFVTVVILFFKSVSSVTVTENNTTVFLHQIIIQICYLIS